MILDAEPIPPLKSKHCIPVPDPTHPSSTGSDVTASSAAHTSSSSIGSASTVESHESSHSVTHGITDSPGVAIVPRDPAHRGVVGLADQERRREDDRGLGDAHLPDR